MLVVKEYIVLSDQASFPPIICFQILFRPKPWYPPAEDQKHTPRFIRGGCNYLFLRSSLARDLLPIQFVTKMDRSEH
ncbi:hypothetical protein GLYMA_16G020900v4 [Glycine max]|uniref:Uncharacterized protein n=2 Tax=Glycine subgen. Soja TaxID=1462606 RepID=K7MER5_SOYBN|nr:hypothetical protein GYH30_043885 [Glycine max]KRH06404.1 hypothetical protein GLYMA_16G020900v4 [Glycine max]RZB59184.1 hypothetical protein D0Y65_042455 [Glycine soja]RZB59185.1 hypothetical protein D0Y65_042455 [Glycine soja]